MATTSKGFRYPALTDAPNSPQDVQNLAEDINGFVVMLDSGTTNITPSGVNVATTLAVAFNKTFAAAPRVFLQVNTGITGTVTCFLWPSSVTTAGFTLNINRSTTTPTSVYWFAVGS